MTVECKTEQKNLETNNLNCLFNLPLRVPLVDAEETNNSIVLKVELPGIKREDIKLSADKDSIEIRAYRKDVNTINEKTEYYSEREYSGFERLLVLPCEIDSNSIDAKFMDGLLIVRINKIKSEKKEISIQ